MSWQQHLSKYRKDHPKLSMKEAMVGASKTYKKQKGGCDGKPCKPCKQKGEGPKIEAVKSKVKSVISKIGEVGEKGYCAAAKKLGKNPERCKKYEKTKEETKKETGQPSNACKSMCSIGIKSKADYRKKALELHPDKNPGKEAEATKKFQDMSNIVEGCLGSNKDWGNFKGCQSGGGAWVNNAFTPIPDGTKRYLVPNFQDNSYNFPAKYDIVSTGWKPYTFGS